MPDVFSVCFREDQREYNIREGQHSCFVQRETGKEDDRLGDQGDPADRHGACAADNGQPERRAAYLGNNNVTKKVLVRRQEFNK